MVDNQNLNSVKMNTEYTLFIEQISLYVRNEV